MIQPLAYIHPEAKIAQNVVIEPFAIIHKDTEIGEGTWIASHAVINEGARIGKNCKIYPGAVIAAVPQDLKFHGEYTTAHIGDNTTVREYVTISRGTEEHWKTEVGNNCLIMAYAHIAHDCVVGNHCIIGNTVQMAGHVHVGDWAIISALSAIHQFVKIGSHVMISGGSLVRKDVPPYVKAAREPLCYVGINTIGLERRGFGADKRAELHEVYRHYYLKGYKHNEALERILLDLPQTDERDQIVEFIRESARGVVRGTNSKNNVESLDD